jgi:hypothetical protein
LLFLFWPWFVPLWKLIFDHTTADGESRKIKSSDDIHFSGTVCPVARPILVLNSFPRCFIRIY